jgi:UDP-N-acetylglucosamine 2-epimerase
LGIRVAHIEAGMRCGDVSMPEELNRRVTDTVASLLFCSTEAAVSDLASEGITEGVHLVGDVMVDALHLALPVVRESCDILNTLALEEGGFIFCTVHRAANLREEKLTRIVEALLRAEKKIVFPVHPGTRKMLKSYSLLAALERAEHVLTIGPVSYGESLILQENAYAILTDSGGVQKEAYVLGRPCLTLRDETEWEGTVEAGWNLLVGTDPGRILEGLSSFRPECDRPNLFGDGLASRRIVGTLSGLGSDA